MVTHGQVLVSKRQAGDSEQFGKRKQDSVRINYHRLHQNVQAKGAFLDILFTTKKSENTFHTTQSGLATVSSSPECAGAPVGQQGGCLIGHYLEGPGCQEQGVLRSGSAESQR